MRFPKNSGIVTAFTQARIQPSGGANTKASGAGLRCKVNFNNPRKLICEWVKRSDINIMASDTRGSKEFRTGTAVHTSAYSCEVAQYTQKKASGANVDVL
jgi:hypothetical protein